jgi:broad specificity phosphatase PhoE
LNSTILTLVRHGETPANTGGIWHGSMDTPLSDRGREQAQRVSAHLACSDQPHLAIYSSPLQRARHTAEAIDARLNLGVRFEAGLTEYDLGSWEGKTYRDLAENYHLWDRIRENPNFAPHGGESPIQVVNRYVSALKKIAATHPGERVIVVGHGGAFSMVLAELVEGTYTNWSRVMSNCALSELVLHPVPELRSFNYTDHLDGL